MSQYLLKISYDGSKYYGWAKQPDVPTVWGEMNKAVKQVFDKSMKIYASGRTDRYVHALALPVLLRGDDSLEPEFVMNKLNELLPQDVRVHEIELVDDDFQVRFDTKGKKYRYLIDLSCTRDKNYHKHHPYKFNIDKFNLWAKEFIGTKDFASFTGKELYQDYTRTVNEINVTREDDLVTFEIIGVGFMRYMVRNIVGALLAHNRGQISDKELRDWLDNPVKGKAHYKAEGSGLYLVEVYY